MRPIFACFAPGAQPGLAHDADVSPSASALPQWLRSVRGMILRRPHPGFLPPVSRRRLLALAATAPLAACASAPDVNAYLASDDGGLKRAILGSRGPLSRSERGAVLSSLPPDLGADALQRQFALQRALSEAPLVFGNTATILRDGAHAFPAMFAAMRAARDHINLEFFIFQDVVWDGLALSELLADKLRHGVTVNIIYDAFGSGATPPALFDKLHAAGARILIFNPLNPLSTRVGWSPNDRDHRKIMVVDGRIGFTGGVNLDKVYENPRSAGIPPDGDTSHAYWRDTAVRIEGPAVAELQKVFFGTWKQQKGPPVAPVRYFPPLPRVGVQTIRIVASAPGDQRPLYYISLMTTILSAAKRVWVSSGYFVPPHQEREDLARTARAGIDLRIVVPSHADVPATVYAARAAYGDLLGAGAHIYEVRNAVLHSKLATIDGVWSTVGSSNLDRRSVVFNNEVDAIILGRDTAAQVEAILRQDMALAHEITLAEWRRRSLAERWDELKARLWQYWM
ncbi:MAG TPA: phospholipase D-like domain-containing protein [Acetobacteraceae bacterium]|nr:phospholipase D-like domain-containing protein [Acetobacteraceae bacterium]